MSCAAGGAARHAAEPSHAAGKPDQRQHREQRGNSREDCGGSDDHGADFFRRGGGENDETETLGAITLAGRQIPLLKLRGPRPQWFRRYWLQEATELPGGSEIEARFAPLGDYSDEMKPAVDRFPLQLAVDYVPQ